MRRNGFILSFLALVVPLSFAAWSGCAPPSDTGKSPNATTATVAGKLPVSTSSDEAKKEFLQGRDLSERLLISDSVQHFDRAISLDPNFAYAELGRANSSPTAKEFFDHLNKAVSLSGKASEGERLLILATEAGANGNVAKQKEYLDILVTKYPNEERGHFNLGGYYFGQQDFPQAINHYKTATELSPTYSPAYNLLGYAYRQNGDYANSEQAFKKYIELIPDDPNPYDSYAELLLKMGKFDDSITQYRKALSIDPKFNASHFGIAADLMYMGKPDEATAELQKLYDNAQSDGDRRTALFGMTVVDVDSGKMDKALADVDKQYALGEKINDAAAMAGDLQTKGTILVEMGKYDEAKDQFDRALKTIEGSNLSQGVKDNARLQHHYNLATVALGKKDYPAAKAEAEEFRKGAEAAKNPTLVRQSHQLDGMIALAQKDYDKAIAELQQAGNQNPQNLYRLCQAYQGKGDTAKAKDACSKAAGFNSLPNVNYAFVRKQAQNMATGTKA